MYNEEHLMHYGVKGMKWGVRRKSRVSARTAEKDGRKVAKALAKQERDNEEIKYAGYYGLSKPHDKAVKRRDQSEKNYAKAYNKYVKKYENTKFSDIKISSPQFRNGRTYVRFAIGKPVYEEDGGYPVYEVAGGTSIKNRYKIDG